MSKLSKKKVQFNQVNEMVDYYKYYGDSADKEIKSHDVQFLAEQVVYLSSLIKGVNDYDFTTQKDAYDTLKKLQDKIRKNVDFSVPTY